MVDSFGKLPSGLLYGDNFWIGGYDECFEVNKITNKTQVQYAIVSVTSSKLPSNPLTNQSVAIDIGACYPVECSSDDLTKRLNEAAKDAGLEANFYVHIDETIPWDAADYVFLVMIGLLFLMNVAVTILDTTSKSNELDSSIFRFFSMKRSLDIFLRRSKSKNVLSTFDGVRAISMTWVVLGLGSEGILT